jgi:hypothetical protein
MQPIDAAAIAGELAGTIQDRADALGITWNLTKGTVQDGRDRTAVVVLLDGDTLPISVVSQVGPVAAGARVWVMTTGPGGNYIVNTITGGAAYWSYRTTLKATAASVTVGNIPTGLRRLRISYEAKSDNGVNVMEMFMRFNGDTSANHFIQVGQANNAAAAAFVQNGVTAALIGLCTGNLSGVFASGQVEIQCWDGIGGDGFPSWTFLSQGLGGGGVGTWFSQYGGGLLGVVYTNLRQLDFFPQFGNFIAGTDIQIEGWPS